MNKYELFAEIEDLKEIFHNLEFKIPKTLQKQHKKFLKELMNLYSQIEERTMKND